MPAAITLLQNGRLLQACVWAPQKSNLVKDRPTLARFPCAMINASLGHEEAFDLAALRGGKVIDLRPRYDARLVSGRMEAGSGNASARESVTFLQHIEGEEATVSFGAANQPWKPGSMVVMAPGARVFFELPKPIQVVALHLGELMVRECWSPLLGRPSGWRAATTGVHVTPPAVFAHMQAVVAITTHLDAQRISCRTATVLGLAEVLSCEPSFTRKAEAVTSFAQDAVDRALRAIEADPALDWSLSRVAGVGGVSPYHMSRLFRAAMGCGLQGHLRAVRVRKACQLLSETRESLVNIAIDSGFSSQSRMTTVFRAELGVTPLAYRQRMWGQASCSAE